MHFFFKFFNEPDGIAFLLCFIIFKYTAASSPQLRLQNRQLCCFNVMLFLKVFAVSFSWNGNNGISRDSRAVLKFILFIPSNNSFAVSFPKLYNVIHNVYNVYINLYNAYNVCKLQFHLLCNNFIMGIPYLFCFVTFPFWSANTLYYFFSVFLIECNSLLFRSIFLCIMTTHFTILFSTVSHFCNGATNGHRWIFESLSCSSVWTSVFPARLIFPSWRDASFLWCFFKNLFWCLVSTLVSVKHVLLQCCRSFVQNCICIVFLDHIATDVIVRGVTRVTSLLLLLRNSEYIRGWNTYCKIKTSHIYVV